MKLRNGFTELTRELFWQQNYCYICGRSDNGTQDHHICGRVSYSPYNLAKVCPGCHDRNHTQSPFTEDEKRKFLQKTKKLLDEMDYVPNEKDLKFLEDNKKYYE